MFEIAGTSIEAGGKGAGGGVGVGGRGEVKLGSQKVLGGVLDSSGVRISGKVLVECKLDAIAQV